MKWIPCGKICALVPWITLVGLVVITVLCACDGLSLAGDRCVHFRAYWALVSLLLILWAGWRKRRFVFGLSLLLGVLHGWPVARLWRPAPAAPVTTPATEFSIISANLYANNRRQAEAVATLMELDPDVLLLMEVTPAWQAALRPLIEKYHQRLGAGGAELLLSRVAWSEPGRTRLTSEYVNQLAGESRWASSRPWENNPILHTTLELGSKRLRIVSIHPYTPSNADRLAQQSAQASAYVEALQAQPATAAQLLIGDFNTTPFSTVFRHLTSATGLRDAGAGFGYRPTWGPRLPNEPWLPWLGIPIDHAFVSSSMRVLANEVGELPGSDHRWHRLRLAF